MSSKAKPAGKRPSPELPPNKDSKTKLKTKAGKENLHSNEKQPGQAKEQSPKSDITKTTRESSVTIVLEEQNKSNVTVTASQYTVMNKGQKYRPIPYTFRLPKDSVHMTKGLVRCPPFHIQLDHTIAVVWSLFSKEKTDKPLGIVQLQWALNFLRNIHNKNGENPKDVAICVQLIEDVLIRQYAEIADELPEYKCCCGSKKQKKPDVSITRSGDSIYRGDSSPDASRREPQTISKHLPFSVNYAEMCRQSPDCMEQPMLEGALSGAGIQAEFKGSGSPNKKKSNIDLEMSSSKVQMMEFLQSWRKEQIGKIQQELKRLHSIEAFIGNVDKDNCQPYLDNEQINAVPAKGSNQNYATKQPKHVRIK